MSRLDELMAEKAAIDAEIAKEKGNAIVEIKAQMARYGVTLADLGAAPTKRGRAPLPARYKGPNGETWSGRGARPRWLTTLPAEGRDLAEFTVKA